MQKPRAHERPTGLPAEERSPLSREDVKEKISEIHPLPEFDFTTEMQDRIDNFNVGDTVSRIEPGGARSSWKIENFEAFDQLSLREDKTKGKGEARRIAIDQDELARDVITQEYANVIEGEWDAATAGVAKEGTPGAGRLERMHKAIVDAAASDYVRGLEHKNQDEIGKLLRKKAEEMVFAGTVEQNRIQDTEAATAVLNELKHEPVNALQRAKEILLEEKVKFQPVIESGRENTWSGSLAPEVTSPDLEQKILKATARKERQRNKKVESAEESPLEMPADDEEMPLAEETMADVLNRQAKEKPATEPAKRVAPVDRRKKVAEAPAETPIAAKKIEVVDTRARTAEHPVQTLSYGELRAALNVIENDIINAEANEANAEVLRDLYAERSEARRALREAKEQQPKKEQPKVEKPKRVVPVDRERKKREAEEKEVKEKAWFDTPLEEVHAPKENEPMTYSQSYLQIANAFGGPREFKKLYDELHGANLLNISLDEFSKAPARGSWRAMISPFSNTDHYIDVIKGAVQRLRAKGK